MAEPFKKEDGDVDVGGIVKFAGTALGTLISLFNPPAGVAVTTAVNVGVDAFDKSSKGKGGSTPGKVSFGEKPDGEQVIKFGTPAKGANVDASKAGAYYGLRDSPSWTPGKGTPIVIPSGGAKSKEGDEDAEPTPPASPEAIDGGAVVVHEDALPKDDDDNETETTAETEPEEPAKPAETVEVKDTDTDRVEVDLSEPTGPARLRAEDAQEMEAGPIERDTSGQEVSWLAGFGSRYNA